MKRFLMLLAVAAVAGGMYVAAATGSQQAKGPTAKQFKALQKQVASLKTQVAQAKKNAASAVGFIEGCFLTSNAGVAPVSVFGDTAATPVWGYGYYTHAAPTVLSYATALDIDGSTSPGGYLQGVDPSCVSSSAASKALMHAGSGRLPTRAEHTP